MVSIYRAEGDLVTASGYAVRLLDSAREGYPLPVSDLRRLREYFEASGETTRVAEVEAELKRRYTDEVAELQERLSSVGKPRPVAKPEAPSLGPRAPSEPLPPFDEVSVSDEERCTITAAVQRLFGFDSLLPGQLETMACVLRGEDVLTILPTGGGKSLCYQLPAMLEAGLRHEPGEQSTTLVISPLIALMKDQVDSLPRSVRRRATTVNSTLDGDELRRRMDRVSDGVYRLVYAAPERLRQPPFLHALRRAGVERLVVDEAHCVSMWGHDFRPDYLIIGRTRETLGDPPLLAMTATAPTRVRRDILERLRSPGSSADGPRIVAGDVTRPNLQLGVFQARDKDEKLRHLLALCQAEMGSGIVYADTRARCERLATLLSRHGVDATHYHAGIADRHEVQDDFMSGRTRVVVATIAFGLGIDKPDIRFIVHFFPPASLESYYQEAGRAGRDGLPARCVLMISAHDKGLLTRRMRRDVLPVEFLREVYAAVKQRLHGKSAGRVAVADLERDLRADDTRVRVALSLLEEAGFLRRGPDLPRAALVRLSAACRDGALPEELAAFRRAAHLRPQQWLTLDLADVASRAGIALAEIEQRMLAWEDAGWLTYRPAGRDLLVQMRPSPEDATGRIETLLERYETVQIQRVDEIAAYASTRQCRHGHLNAYLGGRTIDRCDACDNCVAVPAPPDPGLPDERTQLLTILRCVAEGPWSWGSQTLVRILCGDDKARHGKRSLHQKACAQAEFGALGFRSKTAIQRMLEGLEQAGFLRPRQLKHGGIVLDLTAEGKAALEDSSALAELAAPLESQKGYGSPERPSENEGEPDMDEALFATLRAWRLEQAREQGVPAFFVFHDSHLRAIAANRPITLEALSEVKGVGPNRLDRYGSAVIGLVREHHPEEGD
jgi:ATP-dependent DNA helicase RecQ